MQKFKTKILIITGSTAIGKSSIAVNVAKKFNAEIISADSMQIYNGMNIGTGKVAVEEMDGVVHHLIDIVDASQEFSVSDFVIRAKKVIHDIISRNKNVLITGGTGLYINALINGYNLANTNADLGVRDKYNDLAKMHGNEYIYNILKEIDFISSEKISVNDTKRIVRALEIFEVTGRPKSEQIDMVESEYDSLTIVLEKGREELYKKINARVDGMVANGLLDEVKQFIKYKHCQSMQAIGYKELVEYLENENSNSMGDDIDKNDLLTNAVEKIKKNSRNYAKRQMTYFRWIKVNKVFVSVEDIDNIMQICNNFYTMSDITL